MCTHFRNNSFLPCYNEEMFKRPASSQCSFLLKAVSMFSCWLPLTCQIPPVTNEVTAQTLFFSQVMSLTAIMCPHFLQNMNQLRLTQNTKYSWYIFTFRVGFMCYFQQPLFSHFSENKLAAYVTDFHLVCMYMYDSNKHL